MDFENIDFDDVIENAQKRKKKKNSGRKGKRGERNLAKILKARFGFEFSRTTGSGNRWGQVIYLPMHAQKVFSGDLVCPENFKFVVECKDGYEEIDLHAAFDDGLKQIDKWIKQVLDEADRCKRQPIIVWKKDYKPWLAFIRDKDISETEFQYLMRYKNWRILSLAQLLKLPDSYFFENAEETKK